MIRVKDDGLLKGILTSQNCMDCRACCKFGEDDKVDAPMFTKAHAEELQKRFEGVAFEPTGNLMKIVLKPLEQKGKYVCPLYDMKTSMCNIYSERPFDCITWPYYAMKKDDRVLITLSADCPYVNEHSLEIIKDHFVKKMKEYLLGEIRKYPDLIVDYRNETRVLFDITEELKG